MGVLISVIVFLVIILGVSIYVIRNLLMKNERYEDFFVGMLNRTEGISKKLEEIDHQGHFKTDDEVGFFFNEMKNMSNDLNKFITGT